MWARVGATTRFAACSAQRPWAANQTHATAKRFRRELVVGLSEGLGRRSVSLSHVAERVDPGSLSWITSLGREAAELAAKPSAETSERVQAVMLIGLGPFRQARDVLGELLGPQHPKEVQLAAVQALARHSSSDVPGLFLSAYRRVTPAVRAEMVHQLLAHVSGAARCSTPSRPARWPGRKSP